MRSKTLTCVLGAHLLQGTMFNAQIKVLRDLLGEASIGFTPPEMPSFITFGEPISLNRQEAIILGSGISLANTVRSKDSTAHILFNEFKEEHMPDGTLCLVSVFSCEDQELATSLIQSVARNVSSGNSKPSQKQIIKLVIAERVQLADRNKLSEHLAKLLFPDPFCGITPLALFARSRSSWIKI